MGLLCGETSLVVPVFRHGVEHGVLHKDADCSADEGGEEVNVDVITRAVKAPERLWTIYFSNPEDEISHNNALEGGVVVRVLVPHLK